MALTAAQIQFLTDRGLSAQEIADFALLPPAVFGDPAAAERTARYRERLDVSSSEWLALREQVFARDGWACTYCGSQLDLHCDHIIPLILGGTSEIENLTTACRSCNCGKGGRTPSQWVGGDA